MASSKKAVSLVVALVVLGLMGAFLFPIAINEMSNPESQTATLNTGETLELQPGLNVTLDSVDTAASPSTATYTINVGGTTSTVTVGSGTSTTTTVNGEDVTIAVSSVATGQATATFDYPSTYGWGDGARALWGIIPVILVLALFLYVTFMALRQQ